MAVAVAAAMTVLTTLVACAHPRESVEEPAAVNTTARAAPSRPRPVQTPPAQPRLAAEPAQIADDLVTDERVLRNARAPEQALQNAARRQQMAYRTIGRHPEWDAVVRPRIAADLVAVYDLNITARRHLDALLTTEANATLPAWRVVAPRPADELLDHYREAEAVSGVGWNYLAAVNLVETRLGSITGTSSAGAQGPMQFLPSTFAAHCAGGDIHDPRDAILAAGRYLAANAFVDDPAHALFRYNNSDDYVAAVQAYAAVLAADPRAFAGFYRWEVYYRTTAGDVLLPVGYERLTPVPAVEYIATHPQ
ncbi:MAG: lytic transglycosylase domain-containing protein [Mycolicibacterium neoaurum]|uniref:lytic transglycosylase domain-containing protein n=1 Tax=Mycolicibacterium neoaurum TaxID=1795 RepID=UPI002FFD1722